MNNETFDWNNRDPLFDEVARFVVGNNRMAIGGL